MRLHPMPLLALLLVSGALHAQDTLYTDSLKRFTVRVPEGWPSRDLGDQGVIFYGKGLALQIIPSAGPDSPREAVAALMDRISRPWSNLEEIDRKTIVIMGQETAWIAYNGIDFEGTPGAVRIMGVKGGGVTVGVIISGERAHYNAQRGTIEAILATLRLGTNPPSDYREYATIAPAPADSSHASPASAPAGVGLVVRDLTDDVAQLDPDDGGVVVDRVAVHGPADQAGVRVGDVILELNGTELDAPADFTRLLAGHQAGDSIELLIERKGRQRRVSVKLEAGE